MLEDVEDHTPKKDQFNVWMDNTDFISRPDGIVKNAVVNLISENPQIDSVYVRAIKIGYDNFGVDIVGIQEQHPFNHEQTAIFRDESRTDDLPSRVTDGPLGTSGQDVKDFFGEDVVKTAIKWNRPIVRRINIGRTI